MKKGKTVALKIITLRGTGTNTHVIHKYRLDPKTRLNLPDGSHVLCVQVQRGKPTLWILQPLSEAVMRSRYFAAVPTGEEIEMKGDELYIGTIQLPETGLVFHVWECFPEGGE